MRHVRRHVHAAPDAVTSEVADDAAAFFAGELLDRGDITRFAVLCPPHLVDQWTTELEARFHLRAVPVTAHGAARLERDLPVGDSIFHAHPFTVVSLDYIKSEATRRSAPCLNGRSAIQELPGG